MNAILGEEALWSFQREKNTERAVKKSMQAENLPDAVLNRTLNRRYNNCEIYYLLEMCFFPANRLFARLLRGLVAVPKA